VLITPRVPASYPWPDPVLATGTVVSDAGVI